MSGSTAWDNSQGAGATFWTSVRPDSLVFPPGMTVQQRFVEYRRYVPLPSAAAASAVSAVVLGVGCAVEILLIWPFLLRKLNPDGLLCLNVARRSFPRIARAAGIGLTLGSILCFGGALHPANWLITHYSLASVLGQIVIVIWLCAPVWVIYRAIQLDRARRVISQRALSMLAVGGCHIVTLFAAGLLGYFGQYTIESLLN